MNETELRQAFEEQGYHVIKIKRWGDGDTYVTISDRDKLAEASEFGRTLGVITATPSPLRIRI